MRLADLIDRLLEIQNEHECDDVEVSIMMEHMVNKGYEPYVVQISSTVTDVAASIRSEKGVCKGVSSIIVIGKEIWT